MYKKGPVLGVASTTIFDMVLTRSQKRTLDRVLDAAPADRVDERLPPEARLTVAQKIEMYRASAEDDPRRLRLEETFVGFLNEGRVRPDYSLCPGDLADLLGLFHAEDVD